MTASTDETAFLQKYGIADMSPDRKERPREPLITPAEWAEIDARKANAPYLGWPIKTPLHPNPLVCEIAEMLLEKMA